MPDLDAELRLQEIAKIVEPELNAQQQRLVDQLDIYRYLDAVQMHLRPSEFPKSWTPGPWIADCIAGEDSNQCPICHAVGIDLHDDLVHLCHRCDWMEYFEDGEWVRYKPEPVMKSRARRPYKKRGSTRV